MRIFALGRARVEKDGLPLDSPDWIQKPREMLYFLLSHPEGRTKEQVGLALWPEVSTAQLRSSFHDTLYRLRWALGTKERVSFLKGRYAEASGAYRRTISHDLFLEEADRELMSSQAARERGRALRHYEELVVMLGDEFGASLAPETTRLYRGLREGRSAK